MNAKTTITKGANVAINEGSAKVWAKAGQLRGHSDATNASTAATY
jgi:hypothetical protein